MDWNDLAESQTGDLASRPAYRTKENAAEKHRKEKKAYLRLASVLGDKELYKIWLEFEE